MARQPEVEKAALRLHKQSPELARDYLTAYSSKQAERVVTRWRKLLQELLLKYLDGNIRDEYGKAVHHPYPDSWYKRIVKESGDLFKLKKLKGEPEPTPKPKCECKQSD